MRATGRTPHGRTRRAACRRGSNRPFRHGAGTATHSTQGSNVMSASASARHTASSTLGNSASRARPPSATLTRATPISAINSAARPT